MRWSVGTRIAAGFGAAVVIFIIVGVVSYGATSRLIEASEARKHTFEVLAQLDKTLSLLQDVEIGQRSFALVGDEAFLAPYHAAVGEIEPAMQSIRRLTAANARQQERLDTLAPLIRSRLSFAAESIEARRTKGADAARQLIAGGRGKSLTDQTRKVVGDMKRDAESTLKLRTDAAQGDADNARRTIIFGTLLALILATLAGVVITRDIAAPLGQLTTVAERITAGDLNVTSPAGARSDEVGVLARAFERMTRSLRSMATAAEEIAAGDLRTSVKPQSADDVLGNAFARMTEDLRVQIREMFEGANV